MISPENDLQNRQDTRCNSPKSAGAETGMPSCATSSAHKQDLQFLIGPRLSHQVTSTVTTTQVSRATGLVHSCASRWPLETKRIWQPAMIQFHQRKHVTEESVPASSPKNSRHDLRASKASEQYRAEQRRDEEARTVLYVIHVASPSQIGSSDAYKGRSTCTVPWNVMLIGAVLRRMDDRCRTSKRGKALTLPPCQP